MIRASGMRFPEKIDLRGRELHIPRSKPGIARRACLPVAFSFVRQGVDCAVFEIDGKTTGKAMLSRKDTNVQSLI